MASTAQSISGWSETAKCALVTGASSGIGKSIVSRLLAEGWSVIGVSRTPSGEKAANYHSLLVDLSNFERLKAALESIPRIDAIVHAAGFMR